MVNICKCGCGSVVKRIYVKGHYMRGKKLDKKWCNNISKHHYDISGSTNPMYGKKHSKKTILKMREKAKLRVKEKNGFYGKKHTKLWKKKNGIIMSKINKGRPHTETFKEQMRQKWRDEDYKKRNLKKILAGLFKFPLKTEKQLNQILKKNFSGWCYVGNGKFFIGGKNPDFINKKNKICMETYAPYFKIKVYGSCKKYEIRRKKHFAKYGWKTIFIQSKELSDEKAVVKKITKNLQTKEDNFLKFEAFR